MKFLALVTFVFGLTACISSPTRPWAAPDILEDYVRVGPGTFTMGTNSDSRSHIVLNATPAHRKLIKSSFLIAKTEVTVETFSQIANWALDRNLLSLNAHFLYDIYRPFLPYYSITSAEANGLLVAMVLSFQVTSRKVDVEVVNSRLVPVPGLEKNPVGKVTWLGAIVFCNLASAYYGLKPYYHFEKKQDFVFWVERDMTANGFRLPTEAEWEYSAKGGNKTQGFRYAGSNDLSSIGMFLDQSGFPKGSYPVESYLPNELGLCGMGGNVREWVWDEFRKYDPLNDEDSPNDFSALSIATRNRQLKAETVWTGSATDHLARGGSWNAQGSTSLYGRFLATISMNETDDDVGFRMCQNIPLKKEE